MLCSHLIKTLFYVHRKHSASIDIDTTFPKRLHGNYNFFSNMGHFMSFKQLNSSYIVHFFVFPFSCIKNFRIFSLLGNCNSYRATNSWGEWGKSIILDDSPVSPAFRRAPSRTAPRAPCSTPAETPGPAPPCKC